MNKYLARAESKGDKKIIYVTNQMIFFNSIFGILTHICIIE